ncbi:hypothetical protein Gotur_016498, partial [Gossypium turneri]
MATAIVAPATASLDPTKSHPDVKLFNRWSFEEVPSISFSFSPFCLSMHTFLFSFSWLCFFLVSDISLSDYIGVQPSKHATYVPHTAGRYSVKRFR